MAICPGVANNVWGLFPYAEQESLEGSFLLIRNCFSKICMENYYDTMEALNLEIKNIDVYSR